MSHYNSDKEEEKFMLSPKDRGSIKTIQCLNIAKDLMLYATACKEHGDQEFINTLNKFIVRVNENKFIFSIESGKIRDAYKALSDDKYENISVIEAARRMLCTLNELDITEKPFIAYEQSKLFNHILINHRNLIPPFSCLLAMPKTSSEMSRVFSQATHDKVANLLRDVKFTAEEQTLAKDMTFIDAITSINISVAATEITRCSFPVLTVFLEAKRHGLLKDDNKEHKAIEILRFVMCIEKITPECTQYAIEEGQTTEDFIKSLLPFEYKEPLDMSIFGCVSLSRNKGSYARDSNIQNGKISRESAYRHNLIIFELVLISMLFTEDYENAIFKKLSDYLIKISMYDNSKKIQDAIKLVVPTLFRLAAYEADSLFGDSLSGTSQLDLEMQDPLYSYGDIYGITYGNSMSVLDALFNGKDKHVNASDFTTIDFLSHEPKILLDDKLSEKLWNGYENLNCFARVLFDNNIDSNMLTDDLKEVVIKNVMFGSSMAVNLIAWLPEIMKESKYDVFPECLHVCLKVAIAQAVHYTMREYHFLSSEFCDSKHLLILTPDSNKTYDDNCTVELNESDSTVFKLVSQHTSYKYVRV